MKPNRQPLWRDTRRALWATPVVASLACFAPAPAQAAPAKTPASQGMIECTAAHLQKHNPGLAGNPDRIICFEGYVSNFNTSVAIKVKSKPRHWAVPHWVAHHIVRAEIAIEKKDRPSEWFTVPELHAHRQAPTHDSYEFSKKYLQRHPNWYERGHLAQKYLTERVSAQAAWFTHNVANAVPQRGQFNRTTWLTLECFTGAWANKYGEVWVVTGPIFRKSRVAWLRSDKNRSAVPVAIPVSLFKIVLKRDANGKWDALSFVMPQTHVKYRKGPFDPAVWFKSIDDIERMTQGSFLAEQGEGVQALKKNEPKKLWPVSKADFDQGCKSQRADVS